MLKAFVESFREEYPGGLSEYFRLLRQERGIRRVERRARRRMTPDERVLADLRRRSNMGRMLIEEKLIFTEEGARAAMESKYGSELRVVEFHDGLTVAILKGGRRIDHDEQGRRIS